ncbi:MAG TPA: type II toxin-antitoxin system VapC family toxin [Thermomicrobiaceae bacterium]|nr:type II toxin-antitoxin system VapC family toxin [Thermomicrobiaceae bacterium]
MRRYLLDTTPLAAVLHGRSAAVQLIEPWILSRETATSSLVYAEIVEYLRPRPNFVAHRRALRALLRAVYPYVPTYAILERYADIRLALRPPHGTGLIGDIDTLIAATAMERGLTLVTADSDFERVPGIRLIRLDPRRFTVITQRS